MRPIPPYMHAIPVLFIVSLLTVIVHTHVVDDDRYGFAMFSDIHEYRIDYRWVLDDGTTKRHNPRDLRGLAKSISPRKAPKVRETILGRGFPGQLIRPYLAWAWENEKRPSRAVGIEAEMEIHAAGREWETEMFSYPVTN